MHAHCSKDQYQELVAKKGRGKGVRAAAANVAPVWCESYLATGKCTAGASCDLPHLDGAQVHQALAAFRDAE